MGAQNLCDPTRRGHFGILLFFFTRGLSRKLVPKSDRSHAPLNLLAKAHPTGQAGMLACIRARKTSSLGGLVRILC